MKATTLAASGYSTLDVRRRAVHAVVERGLAVGEAATAYGVDRSTIHRWLARFDDEGAEGLNRRAVPGRPRKLAALDGSELERVVMAAATGFGYETDFWTTRRLIQVMQSKFGVEAPKQTMMRRLQEAGLPYQKPERQYFELSHADRAEWRRKELPKIRHAVRKHKAIPYFQDEANISLTALLAKTWAPRGETPRQKVTGKRGGISAMSAIAGAGQLIFRLHDKRIASEEAIEFLGQMLKHHPRRHLVVVMDQAPPHTSKRTRAFVAGKARLHVFNLTKYSPDWNPDEKAWNHLKHEDLKGHQARAKLELQELANRKLTAMSASRELLQGIFFRCCMAEVLAN